jgi:hypothetical protein
VRTAVRRRTKKPKGAKRVSYELLQPDSTVGEPVYRLLRELVKVHHEHLADARIALGWCTSWRPDVDGRVTLGKCKKASDLDRELASFDFIILLKKSFWQDLGVNNDQRRALLDHELCHAGVAYDQRTGEPVYDERGRKVYRLAKHDLEEFSAIAARYGCWKADIEHFYAALNRSAMGPWRPCATCQESDSPSWVTQADGSVARCPCWVTWRERNREALAS